MHCCVLRSLLIGCCDVLETLWRTVLITPSVPNFVGSSSIIQHTTHPELLYVVLQLQAADVGSQQAVELLSPLQDPSLSFAGKTLAFAAPAVNQSNSE